MFTLPRTKVQLGIERVQACTR